MKWPKLSRRLVAYSVIGIILYSLFLIITLPASWLSWGLARASNNTMGLARASGSAWGGRGELYVHGGGTGAMSLGEVHWRTNPFWLLLGRLQVRFDAPGPGLKGSGLLRLARADIRVWDVQATMPAALARIAYAPVAFFAPTGNLQVKTNELVLSPNGLTGDAEVLWEGAGGRFTGVSHLGDYRLELNGRGNTASLKLATLRGSLHLVGQGQWNVTGNGEIRFTGTATPTAQQAELAPLLGTLGTDQGGGRRQLNFNSRAPLTQIMGW